MYWMASLIWKLLTMETVLTRAACKFLQRGFDAGVGWGAELGQASPLAQFLIKPKLWRCSRMAGLEAAFLIFLATAWPAGWIFPAFCVVFRGNLCRASLSGTPLLLGGSSGRRVCPSLDGQEESAMSPEAAGQPGKAWNRNLISPF